MASFGDLRSEADTGVHAGDLGQQRLQVGRLGVALLQRLGNGARQPLVEGVDRRQRRLVLDDEPQLLAADAVVFGRIILDQRLALFVREVARESRAHVLQPLRPRDEGLVKLPQQFRLGGTRHRIVADDASATPVSSMR